MTNYEAIKLLIEEDVRCDIHGDLYGHERVAEHLAERFDLLQQKIDELEAKLAKCEEQRDNARWSVEQMRSAYLDRGMNF
jgi:uncharacterized small protein (DUF1192 family)